MTIKKLTVAAAIAVGIATCSFSSAMAACPCNTQASDSCGCPCQTTPECNKCPVCGMDKSCCKCQSSCPAPCAQPACATCPSTSCNSLDMKQVYSYPSGVYGSNNYVGEQTNAIYSTETAWKLDPNENLCADGLGVCSGAATPCLGASPCGCGCGTTGAAAPMFGYGSNCCGCKAPEIANSGVAVSRSCCDNNTYSTGAAAPCGCSNGMPIINVAPGGCGCGLTGAAAPCGCGNSSGISIQSSNSLNAVERSFVPFTPNLSSTMTGGAAPLINAFPDVPDNYWAACPIDKLALNSIVVGYPDRTFKPDKCVSRAEFATMMVKGYNLNCGGLESKSLFKDVPCHHWANPLIAKAVEDGIMCGYPNNKFKPNQPVSRVEALTAMAHGINCPMDCNKAKQILSQYCDGASVPDWAQIPVAKALESGVLKSSLNPNQIGPCNNASRAEIADMLQNTRVTVGYDKNPVTANNCCPAPAPCGKTAYMESEQCVKIPTLKLKFKDQINAKSSHVGQMFVATTTEDVTINGTLYPCGSKVNGRIVEVIRPSGCQKGALKVAFTSIDGCGGCKADLPRQILTAQVSCTKNPNIIAKIVEAPFTLLGTLVGTTGRTVGGAISNLGNAVENVSDGTGIAFGDVFQGQLPAAGRSLGDAIVQTVKAPIDITRTALAGTVGLFQTTADEVAFLVDPNGNKISQINPKEQVTIAFGCH